MSPKKNIYIAADNIISPLGLTSKENITALKEGISGIRKINDNRYSPVDFYASLIRWDQLRKKFSELAGPEDYTKFEQLAILSVFDAINQTNIDTENPRTLFIISTTKGSIDVLDPETSGDFDRERLFLWKSADIISRFFGNQNTPIVISNACISGVLALITARRLLKEGVYDNIIVCGADIITNFVVSGFQSFKALSETFCKPFDLNRSGLNLGEGCGTVILSVEKPSINSENILLGSGFSSNDANHISAPSRTGEGLYQVISKIKKAEPQFFESGIDFISAHGTATLYNDDMESTAIARSELAHIPTNSFKGYWGHTLGAAGIIETIASIYSMRDNILFKTAGFEAHGTVQKINIIDKPTYTKVDTCLKLASGFGGCNADILLHKDNG
ncbi:MAG: beta-ketoacyl synthase N-terminal-like domain-containing protein [Bacteroidales bacterium]|nr:beta-ketoacyl synthase N-terminal-like domain-containing protein [Bacteroidales bacterium]